MCWFCCRYLHAFEDFYRKLGSSMGTLSRPGRLSRQSTSRGILSFRIRDKDSSPHSPRPDKSSKEDKVIRIFLTHSIVCSYVKFF